MNDPIFYTQSGLLTAYGFACGYIEKAENNGKIKQLYREHNCYHVQLHDHNQTPVKTIIWDTFPISEGKALEKARKLYKSLKID